MLTPVFLFGLAITSRLFALASASHLPTSAHQHGILNESLLDNDSRKDSHSESEKVNQINEKDEKAKDWDLFRAFINASTRQETNQPAPAIFIHPQKQHHHHRHHHHHHHDHPTKDHAHEQRLTPKEAQDLLFRGTDRGRPVPLNVSQLMPDKCQMYGYEQIVSYPGCRNGTVRNHMCYGLCSSLFVPLEDDFIYSCTACLPTEFKSVAVELECPDSIIGDKLRMHVRVVRACTCLTCTSQSMNR